MIPPAQIAGVRPAVVFEASIPPIKTAITIDGQGDGGEVRLSVDRTNTDVLAILGRDWSERTFYVAIYPAEAPTPARDDEEAE